MTNEIVYIMVGENTYGFGLVTDLSVEETRDVSLHASPNQITHSGVGQRRRRIRLTAALNNDAAPAVTNDLEYLMTSKDVCAVYASNLYIDRAIIESVSTTMINDTARTVGVELVEVGKAKVDVSPTIKKTRPKTVDAKRVKQETPKDTEAPKEAPKKQSYLSSWLKPSEGTRNAN